MALSPEEELELLELEEAEYQSSKARSAPTVEKSKIDQGTSAAIGLGQGLSFGMLDELGSASKYPLGAVKEIANKFGADFSDEDVKKYLSRRDELRAADQMASKANPGSYTTGNVAGGIASSFVPGLNVVKGASLANMAGKASIQGGLAGLGGSDEDSLMGLVKDAGSSAALGAGTSAVIGAAANKLPDALNYVAGKSKTEAEKMAVKATGATGLEASKFKPNAGRALLDNKVVTMFSNPEDIAKKLAIQTSSAGDEINDVLSTLSKGKGSGSPFVHRAVDPEEFHSVINKVISDPNPIYKANITPYSVGDYSKFKTYLSPDKMSGYAVKPDGELISVFSLAKGRGAGLVDDAFINKGAGKLDAFDINQKLPTLYGKYADESSRLKFSEEYAPKDWAYEVLGKPDVVEMQKNADKLKAGIGTGQVDVNSIIGKLRAKADELSMDPSKSDVVRKLRSIIGDIDSTDVKSISALEAENVKRGFDRTAGNWMDPEKGMAAKEAYRAYKAAVEDAAQNVAPELKDKFTAAKERFGLFAPIQKAAERRERVTNQSPIGGLGDMVATGVMGAPGYLAKNVGAPRLASTLAVSLDAVSNVLAKSPDAFGKFSGILSEAARRGGSSLAVTHYVLSQKNPEYQKLMKDMGIPQ